jgi:hypothetical protein
MRPLTRGKDFSMSLSETRTRPWPWGLGWLPAGLDAREAESRGASPESPVSRPQALFISQRQHRIDPRRPQRRQRRCDDRHEH